mmetsp:Transcript_18456/g.31502  ORF Transcript_18456/g.31502 Transcript_18456/m.31502 type:complete len:352 (-) Transcript_18456:101-1156(-)|eukprot:CAMPEP_0116557194 /NCGR_PEP_ID=MMETSP0397-20121206/9102_1 /TAXON_ID=216820 /ORGANISM="Cyclophora tenuis, Strain ECT3854" /LENGTH=351 /DNA_ID=CAMNT_0004082619 /DNA_START=244 /DNA_END=1299 /DNA_ORIENTATION=-
MMQTLKRIAPTVIQGWFSAAVIGRGFLRQESSATNPILRWMLWVLPVTTLLVACQQYSTKIQQNRRCESKQQQDDDTKKKKKPAGGTQRDTNDVFKELTQDVLLLLLDGLQTVLGQIVIPYSMAATLIFLGSNVRTMMTTTTTLATDDVENSEPITASRGMKNLSYSILEHFVYWTAHVGTTLVLWVRMVLAKDTATNKSKSASFLTSSIEMDNQGMSMSGAVVGTVATILLEVAHRGGNGIHLLSESPILALAGLGSFWLMGAGIHAALGTMTKKMPIQTAKKEEQAQQQPRQQEARQRQRKLERGVNRSMKRISSFGSDNTEYSSSSFVFEDIRVTIVVQPSNRRLKVV